VACIVTKGQNVQHFLRSVRIFPVGVWLGGSLLRRRFTAVLIEFAAASLLILSNSFAANPTRSQATWDIVPFPFAETGDERVMRDANRGEERDDADDQVPAYIQELFLGTIVYPQEQGEVQLTGGYFHGHESAHDSTFLFEIEYGITDRFQIGAEVASQHVPDETFQDSQQCSIEAYYNFYSNRRTGRAYGIGFEYGLPIDAAGGEPRTSVYEPFLVAYQDYRDFALNLSAAMEIADPTPDAKKTEVGGDVSLAAFRRVGRMATILEANVEWDREVSLVRIAPGWYWQPFDAPLDLAVSFPIGLTDDTPDWSVFFLAIFEFDASDLFRR
jgi:hypothetical protein